ncbi:MAG: AgmX/PglI C-terminal domain-containing protein [Pseudomonadota bacterium]|nr:AgmX/PglI C-terminal domain-containing protein [Pseudomonadota bacterium]
MVVNTLQATLPWMGPQADDHRFRRILAQVLVICFVIGGIIPVIQVPLVERETAVDLPPRLVRIIEDRIVPVMPPSAADQAATQRPVTAPRPESSQPVVKKPLTVPLPEPQKIPDTKPQPVKARPLATSRQKAAQAGLLAMSDALVELRSIAPKITTTGSGSAAAVSGLPAEMQKPSVLAADITRGSAGIDGGVAHQSVLGATGLPAKGGGSGQAIIRGSGIPPVTGGSPAHQRGRVRSEEEIQEVLDRNKSAMYTIYNRALRQDATLQGKLVMNITIAPSGRVTRCTIIDSELNAASLEEQLIRLIERIDFGNKPGVPVITTKVPIEFFPQ